MFIPKFDELFNPTLEAIKKLGGSASPFVQRRDCDGS